MENSTILLLLVLFGAYIWVGWGWGMSTKLWAGIKRRLVGEQVGTDSWEEVPHDKRFAHVSPRTEKVVTIDLVKNVSYFDVTSVAESETAKSDTLT